MKPVVIVAFGGGLDSTALLVGLVEREAVPNAITFADTGGEKPETYAHVQSFGDWLVGKGFPRPVTVRYEPKSGIKTLEEQCVTKRMLPDIAYGFKGCSEKWKHRPQHKWAKTFAPAVQAWARGEKVLKLIGFDAREVGRASIKDDSHYLYLYPLIEWGWTRRECQDAVRRHGLAVPPKSACFFCPSMKKHEILQLQDLHPELLNRALEMERNAELDSIEGLGRYFSWQKFLDKEEAKGPTLFDDLPSPGCICVNPVTDSDEDE